MLNIIRKFIPKPILGMYHFVLAKLAALIYKNPSKDMIVIGVTGTNGKSTTVNLIAQILRQAGHKVGFTTTVNFRVGEHEWLNDTKMTMLGRFQLQKLLREMANRGCGFVVIETSSQGLDQFRHLGVEYDAAVFTNLAPEHLEAHGGFENYKKAKASLFAHLTKFPNKKINGYKVPKVIVVNADDENSGYFIDFPADNKIAYSIENHSDFQAENLELGPDASRFDVAGRSFMVNLPARFNIYNSLAAIAVCRAYGVSFTDAAEALEKIKGVPGRLEYIDEGQDFLVMVDYAPEPNSLAEVYAHIKKIQKNKLIHVLGSAGGGRDKGRRPILGRMAAEVADYVIVTNEDPYDEDPLEIIDQVAEGARRGGKTPGKDLFKLLDRREAIAKAVGLAGEGDFVLITGKGAEQAMVVSGGRKIPWDDRRTVREVLKKRIH
jgi:UDP-N-acetylmuramoyl-L-alanyl-D-glutamate--2,6-diaminopimelate ligase